MAHQGWGLFQRIQQEKLFYHQKGKEIQSPDEIVPTGPVPDAGGRPHDEQVEHPAALGAAVAPQGDIQVFPEPGGQGDVPPPPELGDTLGNIGVVEVGQELKAQHPAQAYRHVGVAREVKVDLEGEGQHTQPSPRHGQVRQRHGLIAVPQHPHVVGDEQLFAKADHKHLDARGKLVHSAVPLIDLVSQVLILDDGTGDELGKQGDEGAKVKDGSLRSGVSPVHIDGVAHGWEGIEGDTDRQVDTQHRHEVQPDRLERGGDKVPVLEEEQQGQVEHDGGGHRHPGTPIVVPPLAAFYQQAVGIVDGGGQEHDDDIDPLPPVVEKQRGAQDYYVPELSGHQVVDQQSERQKIK